MADPQWQYDGRSMGRFAFPHPGIQICNFNPGYAIFTWQIDD
jgi:hypothetical protein